MIPITHFLALGIALFSIGLATVIVKKNAILVLLGIELMLNGANVNLIGFSQNDPQIQGQIFALFVIVVAAAEAAVALAIVIRTYQFYHSANVDAPNELKG